MIALLFGKRPAAVRPAFVSDPTGCATEALLAGYRRAHRRAELRLFPDLPARVRAANIPPERRAAGYRDLWHTLPRADRDSLLLAVGGGIHGLATVGDDDAVAAVAVADPARFAAVPSQWDVALAPWGEVDDTLLLRGDDVAATAKALAAATGARNPERVANAAAKAGAMEGVSRAKPDPRDLELYARAT